MQHTCRSRSAVLTGSEECDYPGTGAVVAATCAVPARAIPIFHLPWEKRLSICSFDVSHGRAKPPPSNEPLSEDSTPSINLLVGTVNPSSFLSEPSHRYETTEAPSIIASGLCQMQESERSHKRTTRILYAADKQRVLHALVT